jgi:hypothetical protein
LAKRLTADQKNELISIFKKGIKIEELSQKFNCTKLTIVRNLKKELGESKYKEITNKNINSIKEPAKLEKSKKNEPNIESSSTDNSSKALNEDVSDFASTDSFFEIVPLDYEIENAPRKELSSVSISEIDFPKVVYMVVDKKIELEIKLLKDFPEWDFLPLADLNRKTIEIFFDLNLAKRSCNKEQKVLKVPNADVFRIAAPVLVEKGISRIVCAENLIAL